MSTGGTPVVPPTADALSTSSGADPPNSAAAAAAAAARGRKMHGRKQSKPTKVRNVTPPAEVDNDDENSDEAEVTSAAATPSPMSCLRYKRTHNGLPVGALLEPAVRGTSDDAGNVVV